MNEKKIDIKSLIKKAIISLVVIGIFLVLIMIVFRLLGFHQLSEEELQEVIKSSGALAPLVFILMTFLQITFIPIPGTVTIIVGNYLFGFWLGLLYSFIGMILGSLFAFYLGRWFGKKFVYWLVSDKELVDKYLEKFKSKGNVLLFFMFLFPFFPDDILCSVAGIMPLSVWSFIIMQLITRFLAVLGNQTLLGGDVIPFEGWGIVVIITSCIIFAFLFILSYRNAEKISDAFEKAKNKIFKRNKKEVIKEETKCGE